MRVFHEDGTEPKHGEVFVYGANLQGIHGAGAALLAKRKYGAIQGLCGFGEDEKSYGIATKKTPWIGLPFWVVKRHIEDFVTVTKLTKFKWFVTRVGCGLAGFKDEEIAPLFKDAINCSFATQWYPWLKENGNE